MTDGTSQSQHHRRLRFEPLESRRMLSITVDTLVDENNGVGAGAGTSLREAIAAAAPGDTINFSVTGTINLTVGSANTNKQLSISKNLTISGPGADLLTIKAFDPTPATKSGDGSRVLLIDSANTPSLINVSLSGLTLTGADTALAGGAIASSGNLIVTDCVISNSTTTLASFFDGGGGISSSPFGSVANSLTVRNSTFTGNTAPGSEGGAIRKRSGSLTVEGCTFTNNSALHAGAGISASDNNVLARISGSTFTGNQTTYIQFGGGAIFGVNANFVVDGCTITGNSMTSGSINTRASTMLLANTVVSGNSGTVMGGGVYVRAGNLTIDKCTIAGNTGAGVYVWGSKLNLTNSTINQNTYTKGAGIFLAALSPDAATAQISNSTISGNTTTTRGGAIYNKDGAMTIRSSTITNNTSPLATPGAVVSGGAASASTTVESSIIAGNTNGDLALLSATNTFTSLGFNLIGIGDGLSNFNQTGDQTGVLDPMLGALADNGGPTKTHLPLAGSPAIDAGDPAAVAGMDRVPLYDQRGKPYTRIWDGDGAGGARIDIGAVDLQTLPLLNAVYGDYNADGFVDSGDYVLSRKTSGATVAPYSDADGSGNGSIGLEDYDVWRAHYGETIAVATGAGAAASNASLESLPLTLAPSGNSVSQPPALPGVVLETRPASALLIGTPPVIETPKRTPHVLPPAELGAVGTVRDDALIAWLAADGFAGAAKSIDFHPTKVARESDDGDYCDVVDTTIADALTVALS